MKKKMQVDRFEGEVAVLFDIEKKIYDVPKTVFGFELHEGDLLEVEFSEDGKPLSAVFLVEETETLRRRARELRESLRKKK